MRKLPLLVFIGCLATVAIAQEDARVETLFAKLTADEKITLLAGSSVFDTAPIPRLGIPALHLADGPNGVRSNKDEPATAFPTGVALAASWNPPLIREVGAAIGDEARALDVQVVLGPNVNLQRVPLAGRNFESYSEDPYLTGRIGAAFVSGVQSRGVGTSPKHFVANEQELGRLDIDSVVDERTLRELYLAPFESIVREARPWTVMAAYNRVNGRFMTEHAPLLRDVLKGEWGFDGVVMSDWNAVHAAAPALAGGTDLEMPGPPQHYGDALRAAVRAGQVKQADIDDAARRMLRLIVRTGVLDRPPAAGLRRDAGSASHQRIARDVARDAITLLKNEGAVLPLDRAHLRTLAVIGPNADVPLIQGNGSSAVVPSLLRTPLDALRDAVGEGITLRVARGVDNDPVPPPADYRMLSADAARRTPGLAVRYDAGRRIGSKPAYTAVEQHFDKTMFASDLTQLTARWEGWFWPPRDGDYEFKLATRGEGSFRLDGKLLIGEKVGRPLPQVTDFQVDGKAATVRLAKGRGYRVRIDHISLPVAFHQMHFGIRLPPPSLQEAIEAARAADAAIVFVGASRTSESEGRDRSSLALENGQDALVEAVRAVNPNTIVVLHNGGPLLLPWADRVPAIVEAWLPGQQGADALAEILFGAANPAGRLPFTLPRSLEDTPTRPYYPAEHEARYGEGLRVGYRHYETRGIAPLFPFGHGLSYTDFDYSRLMAHRSADSGFLDISVDVKNTGARAGSEVVQLYVSDEAAPSADRPVKTLRGFEKLLLKPGETKTVQFRLQARDFAHYDVDQKRFVTPPGSYRIQVGRSSADIRAVSVVRW